MLITEKLIPRKDDGNPFKNVHPCKKGVQYLRKKNSRRKGKIAYTRP